MFVKKVTQNTYNRNMVRNFLLFLSLLGFLLPQAINSSQLCGILTVPTNLILSQSPYRVVGDLYVAPSARLTIEAGVEVIIVPGEVCAETRQLDWADSQFVSIKVDGSLFIYGTPSQPVRIRPESPRAGSIQWDGIRLWGRNRITTQIQYMEISGAQRAIWARNSTFPVANSIFTENNTGIYMEERSDLAIYNNLFAHQKTTGILIEKSTPSIIANIMYRNGIHAIWSDSRPRLVMRHNLFFGSGDLHCKGCPAGVGRLSAINSQGDSTDNFQNLFKDPLWLDSHSELARRARDPQVATPTAEVKDTVVQRTYAKAVSIGKAGLTPTPTFITKGRAPWILSQYSPALDAAPKQIFFQDLDESPGDLGPFGGAPDRVRLKPPF